MTWGGGQGAGAIATVEQFLIRGLGTACQVCVVGQPRSDSRRSASPLPKLLEDSPDRHQRPGRCLRCCSASQEAARGAVTWAIAQMNPTSSRAMAVMTTGAFFRRASIRRYRAQSRICAFQAMSRTSGGSASCRRYMAWPILAGNRWAQAASTISRRATTLPALVMLVSRLLAWHKTKIGHELARVVEPSHVTDLGDHAGRNNEGNAAECLQRFNDRAERPFWQEGQDLPFDGAFSIVGLIHGVDVGLERDLLCRVLEALIAEPYTMLLFPDCSGIPAAVAQEEALDALARLPNILAGNLARTNEIAYGFVGLVRDPDGRQFSGTREPRQHERITPIGLDVITSPTRRVSRRDDVADVTGIVDLPMQTVPARTGFVGAV